MQKTEPMDLDPGVLETDAVDVRVLASDDLSWVVRIDAEHTGRTRQEYYRVKLREVEKDTGVRISLAAEVDGDPVGFLLGRLYYGEFGLPEPVAILDSLGVSEAAAGKKVAHALFRQLRMNLHALGIKTLQTQVDWQQMELISFFARMGFQPSRSLCLELDVTPPSG